MMGTHVSSFPTPLTPPHTEEEKRSWLRLLRSRKVGVATFFRLMDEHQSAEAALAALPGIAREAGLEHYEPCPEGVVAAELRKGRKSGARLVAFGQTDYPEQLARIPEPPPLVWLKGDPALARRPTLAVIGARNASSLGLRMARRLSADLGAEGFAIVSGLARGVDTAAHEVALETGTIAVFAGGIDMIYPAENTKLAEKIAEQGLLVSEMPAGMAPQARHFPRRNRIVSGLSIAVIVVEAAQKSGSLITAETALSQGREVLAVPGNPLDSRASGCNQLIRDGATLIRSAADVREVLAPLLQPELPLEPTQNQPSPAAPDGLDDAILERLSQAPIAEDDLVRDLSLPAQSVVPTLLALEIEGRITRHSGGLVARTETARG